MIHIQYVYIHTYNVDHKHLNALNYLHPSISMIYLLHIFCCGWMFDGCSMDVSVSRPPWWHLPAARAEAHPLLKHVRPPVMKKPLGFSKVSEYLKIFEDI